MALRLEIVTPEARVYSEDVDFVTLPGVDGDMGIFPRHIPLLTQLRVGEVVARKGGRDFFLAVGDGFVEVTGARVVILTDMANPGTALVPSGHLHFFEPESC